MIKFELKLKKIKADNFCLTKVDVIFVIKAEKGYLFHEVNVHSITEIDKI